MVPMARLTTAFLGASLCFSATAMANEFRVYAQNAQRTYLGCLTCNEFSQDSIWNEFGQYGSEFSGYMANPFTQYGSPFSAYSPCNEFASQPPIIINPSGNFAGYLTIGPKAQTNRAKSAAFRICKNAL